MARHGLIVWPVALPLLVSASAASFVSAKFAAQHLSKREQKLTFSAVVSTIGVRMLLVRA